jgi:hypothetical protein
VAFNVEEYVSPEFAEDFNNSISGNIGNVDEGNVSNWDGLYSLVQTGDDDDNDDDSKIEDDNLEVENVIKVDNDNDEEKIDSDDLINNNKKLSELLLKMTNISDGESFRRLIEEQLVPLAAFVSPEFAGIIEAVELSKNDFEGFKDIKNEVEKVATDLWKASIGSGKQEFDNRQNILDVMKNASKNYKIRMMKRDIKKGGKLKTVDKVKMVLEPEERGIKINPPSSIINAKDSSKNIVLKKLTEDGLINMFRKYVEHSDIENGKERKAEQHKKATQIATTMKNLRGNPKVNDWLMKTVGITPSELLKVANEYPGDISPIVKQMVHNISGLSRPEMVRLHRTVKDKIGRETYNSSFKNWYEKLLGGLKGGADDEAKMVDEFKKEGNMSNTKGNSFSDITGLDLLKMGRTSKVDGGIDEFLSMLANNISSSGLIRANGSTLGYYAASCAATRQLRHQYHYPNDNYKSWDMPRLSEGIWKEAQYNSVPNYAISYPALARTNFKQNNIGLDWVVGPNFEEVVRALKEAVPITNLTPILRTTYRSINKDGIVEASELFSDMGGRQDGLHLVHPWARYIIACKSAQIPFAFGGMVQPGVLWNNKSWNYVPNGNYFPLGQYNPNLEDSFVLTDLVTLLDYLTGQNSSVIPNGFELNGLGVTWGVCPIRAKDNLASDDLFKLALILCSQYPNRQYKDWQSETVSLDGLTTKANNNFNDWSEFVEVDGNTSQPAIAPNTSPEFRIWFVVVDTGPNSNNGTSKLDLGGQKEIEHRPATITRYTGTNNFVQAINDNDINRLNRIGIHLRKYYWSSESFKTAMLFCADTMYGTNTVGTGVVDHRAYIYGGGAGFKSNRYADYGNGTLAVVDTNRIISPLRNFRAIETTQLKEYNYGINIGGFNQYSLVCKSALILINTDELGSANINPCELIWNLRTLAVVMVDEVDRIWRNQGIIQPHLMELSPGIHGAPQNQAILAVNISDSMNKYVSKLSNGLISGAYRNNSMVSWTLLTPSNQLSNYYWEYFRLGPMELGLIGKEYKVEEKINYNNLKYKIWSNVMVILLNCDDAKKYANNLLNTSSDPDLNEGYSWDNQIMYDLGGSRGNVTMKDASSGVNFEKLYEQVDNYGAGTNVYKQIMKRFFVIEDPINGSYLCMTSYNRPGQTFYGGFYVYNWNTVTSDFDNEDITVDSRLMDSKGVF